MTQSAGCGSAAVAVALSELLTLDAQLMVGHSWWALRYVSHPASAGLFLSLRHLAVEHGKLIDKSRLAGAYVVCLLGISGQDREGWLVLADGLLTLGIAPFRQLQQGVV